MSGDTLTHTRHVLQASGILNDHHVVINDGPLDSYEPFYKLVDALVKWKTS